MNYQLRYDGERGIYCDCKWCGGKGCLACPGEAKKLTWLPGSVCVGPAYPCIGTNRPVWMIMANFGTLDLPVPGMLCGDIPDEGTARAIADRINYTDALRAEVATIATQGER